MIAQLITSFQVGGAENVAISIAEHLAIRGENVVILEVFRTNTDYANKLRSDLNQKNIQTLTLSFRSKRIALFLSALALAKWLMSNDVKIVHSHTDLPDFVLSLAVRILKYRKRPVPHIVRTIHNVELWPTHNLFGRITEVGLSDSAIVAVSQAALDAYKNIRMKYRVPLAKIAYVLYNGCRVPQALNFAAETNDEKVNICFCGRLDQQKGVDVLVDRIKATQHMFSGKFKFHLIGDGPLRSFIETELANVSDVVYYGPLPKASSYFHLFQAMVMTSRFEGLPLVSIEAALAGIPTIASRAPGLNETLPGNWPLYFDLANECEFLQLFQDIANRKYDLGKLGVLVRDFATERFGFDAMIAGYQNLYDCFRIINEVKIEPIVFSNISTEK